MVFLKTKDVPPKRTFIIVLCIISVSTLILSLHTIGASSDSLVKDDSVTIPSAEGIVSETKIEEDLATDNKPLVTTYKVVSGDTVSGIAEKFDVSTNTIRWANDLSAKSTIHIGDTLKILPVSGVQYTVKKGDTISGIAVKFDVSQSAILEFNDIDSADKIIPGVELIIPDGEPITPPKPVTKSTTTAQKTATVSKASVITEKGYYTAPLPGSVLSQGLHDGTAVDMATKVGSTVYAAAAGTVTTTKDKNTWNGGYGYYIIIKHDNGTQTLYAHLSRIDVEVGQNVEQGEAIALSGKTGRVTGPHLHFEVRGATNPFAKDKVGTRY